MDVLSCLVFISLFSQKSPIIIGSFAKRDRCLVATRQRQDIQTRMHKMPYLYMSFFAKEPYDYWLFCETWPMSCRDKTATRLADETKMRHHGYIIHGYVYTHTDTNTRICLHASTAWMSCRDKTATATRPPGIRHVFFLINTLRVLRVDVLSR